MRWVNLKSAGRELWIDRRRRLLAMMTLAAGVFAAGLGLKFWIDHRVPSPDASPERLVRFMASPAFASLPDARKSLYMSAFERARDRGELTAEQQRRVIDNASNPSRKDPIRQYLSLAHTERVKFLDDIIDRVLKADRDNNRQAAPTTDQPKELRIDRGRLADTIPPEDRARMGQFLQDLHDRRVARGVFDDGRFLFNLGH